MSGRERVVYRLLVSLSVAALIAFAVWLLQPAHLPDNFHGPAHLLDVGIFAAVVLALGHGMFMDAYLWIVVRKIQPKPPVPPTPEQGLRVAFITTFVPNAEGLDLLRGTLTAMRRADYPHDVWLLDEGASPAASLLARELGVKYFTRNGYREYNLVAGPYKAKTKGGNHNSWYDRYADDYDVVAQIDTDFTPRRDFLTQTLGYFADPEIAWVGTPQIYGNTDSFIARGAGEQQFGFYGPVLRGLAGRRMANMLGANHVVRVAALRDIDFYAGHLTEDLLTGMRLHARGWRSTYVAEPLALGEGPDTWKAYFNQQMRWAYGCMDILKRHTGTLAKTMPKNMAGLYLSLQQGYFAGVAGLIGVTLLVGYFFFRLQICRVPVVDFLEWFAPLYAMQFILTQWIQRFNVRPDAERGFQLAGRVIGMAAWPIYLVAAIKVFRQEPLGFKVTPKGAVKVTKESTLRLFVPHAVLAGVSTACIVAGIAFDRTSPVLLFWAAITAVQLGAFTVYAAVADLRAARAARRATQAASAAAALPPIPIPIPAPIPAPAASAFAAIDDTFAGLA